MTSFINTRLFHLHWKLFIISDFWITFCSFYISTCCFTLLFYVMYATPFLIHHVQLLASNSSSAVSSHPLAFMELQRVRNLLWTRHCLKEMWLVRCFIQTTETWSLTATRQFHFLSILVFTGVALLISPSNPSFAFTAGLTVQED